MKRWLWYAAALVLVAALGGMPFSGTDVAKLQPVELIRVSRSFGQVLIETDTGDSGIGADLEEALEDMKETATADIFLDTAEHLLVSQNAVDLLPKLAEYLRPACGVCLEQGAPELEQAAAYLAAHEPEVTLKDFRAGERNIPVLITEEGRMHLVS